MESSINIEPEQDKPHDLSMKTNHDNTVVSHKNLVSNISSIASTNSIQNQRKVKHIPPPLDLNAHTLEPDHVSQGGVLGGVQSHLNDSSVRVPKSPNELPRESLPLRKR